jgi:hypothetical protein
MTADQLANLRVGQVVKLKHLSPPGRITRIFTPADGQRVIELDVVGFGGKVWVGPGQIVSVT